MNVPLGLQIIFPKEEPSLSNLMPYLQLKEKKSKIQNVKVI